MNITRYDPVDFITAIQEDINNLFRTRKSGKWMSPLSEEVSGVWSADWTPAVDIKEEDGQFLVNVDVPGVDAKDIDVSMHDGNLIIKGERKSEKKEDKKDYHRVERSYGSFYRSFRLPDTANPEKVSATVSDGVLNISIGKKKTAKAHKITVQSK